jgi:hypothetical protein
MDALMLKAIRKFAVTKHNEIKKVLFFSALRLDEYMSKQIILTGS